MGYRGDTSKGIQNLLNEGAIMENGDKPKIDHQFPNDFEQEFSEIFENEEFEGDIKLYRVRKQGTKYKSFYLRRYEDHCPTYEEIGIEYGAGQYKLYSLAQDGSPKTRNVYLDPVWDEKKRQIQPQAQTITPADIENIILKMQQNTGKSTGEFEMFAKAVELLTPLFKNGQGQHPSAGLENVVDSFALGIKKLGDTMIKQKIENVTGANEKPELPPPEPAGGAATTLNIISQVKEVLQVAKEAGDTFLNSKGVTERLYKKAIMESDIMKEAMDNSEIASCIFTAGCEDPDIGPEKTRAMFKKLGFDIEEPQQEAA